jgi:hypothetical protein
VRKKIALFLVLPFFAAPSCMTARADELPPNPIPSESKNTVPVDADLYHAIIDLLRNTAIEHSKFCRTTTAAGQSWHCSAEEILKIMEARHKEKKQPE